MSKHQNQEFLSEYSGRMFNKLCKCRDVLISRLDELLNNKFVNIDEYTELYNILYGPKFNQETLTECSMIICDKMFDQHETSRQEHDAITVQNNVGHE